MPIRGEASARLANGKTLTLKVNFATLARVAAQVGIAAPLVLQVMSSKDDPRQMLVFLAMAEHALKKHHPGIDEDAIGDMMLTDGQAISAALTAAAEGAFSDDLEAEGKEGPNPPNPGPLTHSKRRGQARV